MATAISKLVESEYILKADEGTDNPATFTLRPLTGLQRIAVRQAIGEGNEEKIHRLCLVYGLAGWKNLKDADGHAVAWAPGNMDRNLDCLAENDIYELARAVFSSSFLTEAERKN